MRHMQAMVPQPAVFLMCGPTNSNNYSLPPLWTAAGSTTEQQGPLPPLYGYMLVPFRFYVMN
jgi:hypothetical protein